MYIRKVFYLITCEDSTLIGNADLVDVSEGEDELDGEVRIDEEG